MGRRLVVLLSLVGIGAVGGPSIADAAEVKTKATMGLSYFPETESRNYEVFVEAPKEKCVPGRKASVFQKVQGKDELIGKGTTNDFGGAFISDSPTEPFVEGDKYYAKVKKAKLGSTTCTAAKTKTFTIGPS